MVVEVTNDTLELVVNMWDTVEECAKAKKLPEGTIKSRINNPPKGLGTKLITVPIKLHEKGVGK